MKETIQASGFICFAFLAYPQPPPVDCFFWFCIFTSVTTFHSFVDFYFAQNRTFTAIAVMITPSWAVSLRLQSTDNCP